MPSLRSVVRRLTVIVVASFLAVLGWYLGQPGYTVTRLVFFSVFGGLAVAVGRDQTHSPQLVQHSGWKHPTPQGE